MRNVEGHLDAVTREIFVIRSEKDEQIFREGTERYKQEHASYKDMLNVKGFEWDDKQL